MSEPNLIPITRPVNNNNPVQPLQSESKFPTEVINLPSKGWFYPTGHPLENGTLELKQMTAKEEDLLTSPNLHKKKIVLDKLLESVIVDKKINANEMLVCDRNAAYIALRRLAYGDKYEVTINCPSCGVENDVSIDLNTFDNQPFDFEKYPKGQNSFDFVLPTCKRTVSVKLLSKKDEIEIEREIETLSKISSEISKQMTTWLIYCITSIDGNTDKMKIRKFVNEELLSKDSLALRRYMQTLPNIDTKFDFNCYSCGLKRREDTPIGVSFFWPK